MAGGASEYVLANSSGTIGNYSFSSLGSDFDSTWYNSNSKYLTTYAYISSRSNATTQVGYNIARLGDATGEIILSSENTWYNDIVIVPYYDSSWFVRGGLYSRGANGEIFNFYSANGNYTTGYSSRTVIFIK